MLSGPTGLHHQDQKLLFKDKERDSKVFLDVAGVKDRSKIVLVEDPISQEKRYLEMRKNAKMEKASKSISEISLEVDRLAGQVFTLSLSLSVGRIRVYRMNCFVDCLCFGFSLELGRCQLLNQLSLKVGKWQRRMF